MKTGRYCFILPVLLTAALAVGCKNQPSQQKIAALVVSEVEKANKIISGKHVDAVTICDSLSFDGKNVFYHNTLDEDIAQTTIQEYVESAQKDALEINLQLTWATNPSMEPVKNMVRSLGGMIYYNYTGPRTGESFTITIDPED